MFYLRTRGQTNVFLNTAATLSAASRRSLLRVNPPLVAIAARDSAHVLLPATHAPFRTIAALQPFNGIVVVVFFPSPRSPLAPLHNKHFS